MAILDEVERAFGNCRTSGEAGRALEVWRCRQPGLEDVGSLEILVARCRGPKPGSRSRKDRILVALCLEACGEKPDELAAVTLCWLFLPGLHNLLRDLAGPEADRDEVAAELLTGFWEAALRVRVSSTHVARHLLRGARRCALRGLRAARASRTIAEADGLVDGTEDPRIVAEDRLRSAISTGVLSVRQADLLLTTRSSIVEVAARHGLSVAAAQQVRHRARLRLRAWLTDS